ncbi:serine/threonine-protein kinase ULK3-like [Gigantopelta aegis]|uniref:serine/threonine-protein kinase ULK3-like n=1 Tax=Gigantopelta aegis TaxID=1735272 RepID=UPI001B88C2E2|nr:serine/threonine-protein kinase ULK3-like [Gigantopelta aegis]
MARPSSASSSPVVPKLKEYIFTDKLGSGTYATVYKAYKKTGKRDVVAIKCVLKTSLNKPATENLLTEIELLKKLKHDNIVELKDFLWDEKYIYLIMEYCSGGDLSHFIRSRRTLPERIVKRFLQQIAQAMMYLWSFKVAHMDLKPQNILLTSSTNPTIKIADFGFAKHLFEGDDLHIMRGSPLYMAPEIICQTAYDARVDLWSIGVILYECLFGKAPFASESFKELSVKLRDSRPVQLPYGVEISDEARDLILRLLKRNPDERISFDEFFLHPFVDLDHVPSKDSLPKAIKIVTEAVEKDEKGDFKKAVKLYCSALEYFMSAIQYETNPRKKDALRRKVQEYMDRAEFLRTQMKPCKPSDSVSRSLSMNSYEELVDLCQDRDELLAALKLIKAAEIEAEKEEYSQALKHYELALGVFIKTLPEEPKGRRKDLLNMEVTKWMAKAENIKSYLSVRVINTEDTSQSVDDGENLGSCSIQ